VKYNGVNFLSNTTIWWRYICVYMYYILFITLHVSELDNGHLQVVYEIFSKQLYKFTYLYVEGSGGGVKWARDFVSVRKVVSCGLHGGLLLLPSYV